MRLGGAWERMATAGSGGLFAKIIKGLEKKTHLLGLMTRALMESLCRKSADGCSVRHVYVEYKLVHVCVYTDA